MHRLLVVINANISLIIINDHGYVQLVVNTPRSFPRSWLITGFVTRLTRRVPLVEQGLLTLPEHLSSLPVFCGVRITQSLVLYVFFCTFYFGHCVYLFFFDIRILITPLVSSNSPYYNIFCITSKNTGWVNCNNSDNGSWPYLQNT